MRAGHVGHLSFVICIIAVSDLPRLSHRWVIWARSVCHHLGSWRRRGEIGAPLASLGLAQLSEHYFGDAAVLFWGLERVPRDAPTLPTLGGCPRAHYR